MAAAKDFALWFLQNVPAFLISEPIAPFLGLAFLAVTVQLFRRIIHVTD